MRFHTISLCSLSRSTRPRIPRSRLNAIGLYSRGIWCHMPQSAKGRSLGLNCNFSSRLQGVGFLHRVFFGVSRVTGRRRSHFPLVAIEVVEQLVRYMSRRILWERSLEGVEYHSIGDALKSLSTSLMISPVFKSKVRINFVNLSKNSSGSREQATRGALVTRRRLGRLR